MNIIEKIQNISNLFICTLTSLNIYYYYIDQKYLIYSVPFILTHFCIDLFFCKNDIKIHHILGIILILCKYSTNLEYNKIIILTLYKTEISTFFYLFRIYAKNNYFPKNIILFNDICFFFTFLKFRIIDYYLNIIINPYIYLFMDIYFFALYGLFALNLYWFLIIIKILCKSIINYFSEIKILIISHKLLSYIFFLNIFISCYVYLFLQSHVYLFDIIGILILSCNNYFYHNKMHNILSKDYIVEITSDKIMKLLLNYKSSIHIRSLLCLITKLYYTDNYLIFFSLYNHIYVFYNLLVYISYLKNNKIKIFNNFYEYNLFFDKINFLTIYPIIFDIILIIYFTHTPHKFNLIISSILLLMILIIKPFYYFNDLIFDIILMINTFFLSSCNLQLKII